jgi:hypothetical protein
VVKARTTRLWGRGSGGTERAWLTDVASARDGGAPGRAGHPCIDRCATSSAAIGRRSHTTTPSEQRCAEYTYKTDITHWERPLFRKRLLPHARFAVQRAPPCRGDVGSSVRLSTGSEEVSAAPGSWLEPLTSLDPALWS